MWDVALATSYGRVVMKKKADATYSCDVCSCKGAVLCFAKDADLEQVGMPALYCLSNLSMVDISSSYLGP